MAKRTEARWLLLGESADLFLKAGNPWQAFVALLTSGQVRVAAKRDGYLNAEPIEGLLRRAGEVALFDISIRPDANQITVSLRPTARSKLSYADVAPQPETEAQISEVLGAQWREYLQSDLTFAEVRIERATLVDAAVMSGYTQLDPIGVPGRPMWSREQGSAWSVWRDLRMVARVAPRRGDNHST